MPRPRKPRTCICPHRAGYAAVFKPAGTPLKDMEIVQLAHDELDALYLCDGEGKTQEEAGIRMGVSRGTVQRLLSGARRKVAEALVGQKALAIEGPAGKVETVDGLLCKGAPASGPDGPPPAKMVQAAAGSDKKARWQSEGSYE